MAIFEIRFKRRISGYGGPGSSWATDTLTLVADNKRAANKFFKEEVIMRPEPDKGFYGWGINRREMGTWYRAVEVSAIDISKYTSFDTFEPRLYTQDELRKMVSDIREWRIQHAIREAKRLA